MSLAARTRLGRYEIQNPLGAGGMGEVYRARDERLGRDVAIKVLPAELTSDRNRLKRFETEARAACALTHPNIVTIHHVDRAGTTAFIVMELVEGKTLRKLLAGGALPLRKVLSFGAQIAEGLARAHAAGIVHRDLKPENVMVTSDGLIKILDFGLAKLAHPEDHEGQPLDAATVSQLTTPGIAMGTVGYMSPEQAGGHPVDFRSDQFSLGSIVYEMATGTQAFKRATAVQTMAAIIQEEPESIAALNSKVPAPLRWIVERCLAKEPGRRYASTDDLARELATVRDRISEFTSGESAAAGIRRPRRWLIGAAAVVLLAVLAALALLPRAAAPPSGRRYFDVVAPEGAEAGASAVSPDGQRIVFEARRVDGTNLLYVREFSEADARPVPGTETAREPFWSPDSRTVGFFTRLPTQEPRGGKLKRIGIRDASPLEICDAPDGEGGSWAGDDTILFGRMSGPIHRVPASGGQPAAVTRLEASRGERAHGFPTFLPDGRRFLFTTTMKDGSQELVAGSLDGATPRRLGKVGSPAAYAAPGYVVSIANGSLVADRFDVISLRMLGRRVPVATTVGESFVSASSRDGVLSYSRAPVAPPNKLVWFDRSGTPIERVTVEKDPAEVEISPDGSRAVLSARNLNASEYSLWLYELGRGSLTRLTLGSRGVDIYPVWSPDGKQVAFATNRNGSLDVYVTSATGLAGEVPLFESTVDRAPNDWSRDGRTLLFEDKSEGKTSLWAVDPTTRGKPYRLTNTPFREEYGRFSPDGHLIAYLSDETGRNEVYVQPFPVADRRWQISTTGAGQRPLWRSDGKELFYVSADNRMMSVNVELGPEFRAGKPRALFLLGEASAPGRASATNSATRYAVTPDGQRFLVIYSDRDAPRQTLTVVSNWAPEHQR